MTCGSGVLSRWASAGACGVGGGRVLCRRGPKAARSGWWEEVVRRGGVEGHALPPPRRCSDLELRPSVSWRRGGTKERLGFSGRSSCWVRLLSSLGLPASLSVPPR